MAECTYAAGNQIWSDLDEGYALLSMYTTFANSGDVITTSFMDCHPVASYAHGAAVTTGEVHLALKEADGVITFYGANTTATHLFLLIHGRKF
jgi:hypothetical protein